MNQKAKDTRPVISDAPEWVSALAKECCDKIDPMFEELWTKAVHGAAASVERGDSNPAEAQNDSLSVIGQVASYTLILLMERLTAVKGVPPDIAAEVALLDAKQRIEASLDRVIGELELTDPFEKATFAAREWLLGQADIGLAAKVAEEEANDVSERLNARTNPTDRLNTASSFVARALIANAILQTAGDWLATETAMPPDLARATIESIADELPEGLAGRSFIKPELVQ